MLMGTSLTPVIVDADATNAVQLWCRLLIHLILKSPLWRLIGLLLISCLLNGCAKFLLGDRALNRNPTEKPSVNLSDFSVALECMDQMQLDYNAPTIVITAQDIPNKTAEGGPLVGTKDMLITSLSKISERSGRVHFVSYGTELRDIILLHKVHDHRDDFITPDYFILGSITQLDKNVLASRFGGALNSDTWNSTYSSGQGISYAGLDLNVGFIKNLQMIPGMTSSNVLALYDRGAGTDLGGRINSVGAFFDFGIDRRDGLGQAIRNMMDLATIELIGKLQNLPYLTCLPVNPSQPEVDAIIRKEYLRFQQNPQRLIQAIQGRLHQLGYYNGPIDGQLNQITIDAIGYFRQLYQLPNQNILAFDYEFYKTVMYREPYHWDSKDPAQPAYRHVQTQATDPTRFKYTQIQQQQQLRELSPTAKTYPPANQPAQPSARVTENPDILYHSPDTNNPRSAHPALLEDNHQQAPSTDQPTFDDVKRESSSTQQPAPKQQASLSPPTLWSTSSAEMASTNQTPKTSNPPKFRIFDN